MNKLTIVLLSLVFAVSIAFAEKTTTTTTTTENVVTSGETPQPVTITAVPVKKHSKKVLNAKKAVKDATAAVTTTSKALDKAVAEEVKETKAEKTKEAGK